MDELKRIEPLIKDNTDAILYVAGVPQFFAPINKRKEFSQNTQELKIQDLFRKVDEISEVINLLIDKQNAK